MFKNVELEGVWTNKVSRSFFAYLDKCGFTIYETNKIFNDYKRV